MNIMLSYAGFFFLLTILLESFSPALKVTVKHKTVREAASKKLFGFAELGCSHKEKITSVDERSSEFFERSYSRRDVGTPRLGLTNDYCV